MIFGYLVEERADAWVVDVAAGYGDAGEFGIFGRVEFPRGECVAIADRTIPQRPDETRVRIVAPRETLEALGRNCY